MWWFFACQGANKLVDVEVEPSTYVDNAFWVSWTGPAGSATLEVEGVAGASIETDGPTRLSLVGLPAGERSTVRAVVIDEEGARWESGRLSVDGAPAPADLPDFRVTVHDADRSEADEGSLLLSWFVLDGPSYAVLVDGRGRPTWWVADDGDPRRIVRARWSHDERAVVVAQNHRYGEAELGTLTVQSLDGDERTITVAPGVNHDLHDPGNGTLVYLSHSVTKGLLPPLRLVTMLDDQVRVVPVGATDPALALVVFDFEVDYPFPPWSPCPHAQAPGPTLDAYEWTHANSLVPAADGDGWWVMARWLDALVRIGADGGYRGQIGGRDSTWTQAPATVFRHAHFSAAEGDRVWLFDNGWTHDASPDPSRAMEIALDEATSHTAFVWEAYDPEGGHTGFLGDVTPLPGGNRLVTFSAGGRVLEFTPDGEVVWELDVDNVVARVQFSRSLPPR